MSERTMIEVELTFRPESEGGRHIPDGILSGYTYRPHIVIGSPAQQHVIADGNRITEDYLGVAFNSGPKHIQHGQPFIAQAARMRARRRKAKARAVPGFMAGSTARD